MAARKQVQSVSEKSEIRRHYYLDEYVIIAPKRGLRPDSFTKNRGSHKSDKVWKGLNDPAIFRVDDPEGNWLVKVVANLFPALSLDNPEAYGKQEIVIETPDPGKEFSELAVEQIERIFLAYRQRLDDLKSTKGIRYVSIFKNDGPEAGASVAHAHSQIAALPVLPPDVLNEAVAVERYLDEHGECPHCELMRWEHGQKVRVIYDDKHFFAVCPYPSNYPYAVWLIPVKHRSNFSSLTLEELSSLAVILKKVAGKLDSINLSFNFFLHESLPEFDHHFYIKVEPRGTVWAGLEMSTGVIVNPVPPEFAALWYNDKIK